MSPIPEQQIATKIADLSRLKLLDTAHGRAGQMFSATFGASSIPLLHLRIREDGMEVDLFHNELRFLADAPAFISVREPAFTIPAGLAGDPGHLLHVAGVNERDAGNLLYQRFRHLVEPGPLWLARGSFELQERFLNALGMFRDGAILPTYVSADDPTDYLVPNPDFPRAFALGTAWFHPVAWTPVIENAVLEHRPVYRTYLWGSRGHESGHDAMEEADWLYVFLRQMTEDLGVESFLADDAMRELSVR